MARRLTHHLNSDYLSAASRLRPQAAKRKIVAYVESYEDVLFWSTLLREVEDEKHYFEVMLPSKHSLSKGKKVAIMNELGPRLGACMIACVDADYDYLLQDTTRVSRFMNRNPYIFHTYAYSIENYQCFAPALRQVTVMATLNDHRLFDFEAFLTTYSDIIFPLFVWNVWCYRHGVHKHFDLGDFAQTVQPDKITLAHTEQTLDFIRRKVNRKIAWLQRHFPKAKADYKQLADELKRLGVTPRQTYLFMRGHDLFDTLIAPLLLVVSERLRRERENEIRRLAVHETQLHNELASYRHSVDDVNEVLRRHTYYKDSALYRRIQDDVRQLMASLDSDAPTAPSAPEPETFHAPADGEAKADDFAPGRLQQYIS